MSYVAFDIGNVLVKVDLGIFGNKYHKYCNVPEDYMDFLSDLHYGQDIGVTTIRSALKDKYGGFITKSNLTEEIVQGLEDAWDQVIIPNQKMLNFVSKLKADGVNVALLSNMGPEHAAFIRKEYPEIFESCILHLSYEVGARKPTKLFYQSFLCDHPDFVGCVYLDDLDANIEAGHKYGFNCHKFELDDFDMQQDYDQDRILKRLEKEIHLKHGDICFDDKAGRSKMCLKY